jgi:endoplasmic reticulum Man9GlcNAc2 1,2-alpha-mannosidase
LLFSPNDLLPLDKVVFNTEAHPFPKFEMGGMLKTGWKRKKAGDGGGLKVQEVAKRTDAVEEAVAKSTAAVEKTEDKTEVKTDDRTDDKTEDKADDKTDDKTETRTAEKEVK